MRQDWGALSRIHPADLIYSGLQCRVERKRDCRVERKRVFAVHSPSFERERDLAVVSPSAPSF